MVATHIPERCQAFCLPERVRCASAPEVEYRDAWQADFVRYLCVRHANEARCTEYDPGLHHWPPTNGTRSPTRLYRLLSEI